MHPIFVNPLHQASLLSAQVLLHLNEAAQHLTDSRTDGARPELEQAVALAKVVRSLLPVTVATTTVRDAQGKEVYRNVQRIQDDLIPIFAEDMVVKLVEPVLESKRGEEAIKGLRLADADLIRKSVLVDLSYVERKLKRASELLGKPQEALAELVLAQASGVHFHTHKADVPLMDVQVALSLAERMVDQKQYGAAKDNLLVAKQRLEAFRQLMGKNATAAVVELEKEIERLSLAARVSLQPNRISGLADGCQHCRKGSVARAQQVEFTVRFPRGTFIHPNCAAARGSVASRR